MKKLVYSLLFILTMTLSCLCSYAATDVTTCINFTAPGEYVFQDDITVTGECFVINSSNVTVDGKGHSIFGNASFEGFMAPNYHFINITVRDFKNISGFINGITFYGVNDSYIINNTIYGSGNYGLHVYASSNNQIIDNTIINSSYSINVDFGQSNVIENNTITTSSDGGIYCGSDNSMFFGNNISNSLNYGIYQKSGSINNTYVGNSITSVIKGFYSYGISNWTYVSNNTIRDVQMGIHMWSNHSIFESNTFINFSDYGLCFANPVNSTIINNSFSTDTGAYKVYLSNTRDIIIVNNSFYNGTGDALYGANSMNISFDDNFVYNFNRGVQIYNLNESFFTGNTFKQGEKAGYFNEVGDVTFSNNTINDTGIAFHLDDSQNITFLNNNMYNVSKIVNFVLPGMGDFSHNFSHNFLDDIYPFYYNFSIKDITFSDMSPAAVYCINCTNITYLRIEANVSENDYKIYFFNSTNMSILDSVIKSDGYGAYVRFSELFANNSKIYGNSTSYGIDLYRSDSNVSYCNFSGLKYGASASYSTYYFDNNEFFNSSSRSLFLTYSNLTFRDNRINGSYDGLKSENSNVTVLRNEFLNTTRNALYFSDTAAYVENNNILDCNTSFVLGGDLVIDAVNNTVQRSDYYFDIADINSGSLPYLNFTSDNNISEGYIVYTLVGINDTQLDSQNLTKPGLIIIYDSHNLTLRNFSMDLKNSVAVNIDNSANITMDNISISDSDSGVTANNLNTGVFNNFLLENVKSMGLYVSGSGNITMINNTDMSASLASLAAFGTYVTLENNKACNSTYDIYVTGSYSASDNYCDNAEGFNDTGAIGCKYSCADLNAVDSDNDGIADSADNLEGNVSNISNSGFTNINLRLNGSAAGNNYDNVTDVTVLDSSSPVLNFTHNFTAGQLDLTRVSITKGSNSVVINLSGQLQANYNKTVWIDDNSFVSLCVKDADVSSASGVSSACNDTNETDFTTCLGNSTGKTINGITCIDHGSRIEVQNLRHSAIVGVPSTPPPSSPSSSGGSSGSYGNTYLLEDTLDIGSMRLNDVVRFMIQRWQYTIKLVDVDDKFLEFYVYPGTYRFKIDLGETSSHDVDGDGNDDFSVRFNSERYNKANVSFVRFLDSINETEQDNETTVDLDQEKEGSLSGSEDDYTESETTGNSDEDIGNPSIGSDRDETDTVIDDKNTSKGSVWKWILIGTAIAAIILLGFFFYRKKQKEDRLDELMKY